jgi:hypothetical protein
LGERDRVIDSASDIQNAVCHRLRWFHLPKEQGNKVARAEIVSNLMPAPTKADISEGSSLLIGVNPERQNTLIGATKLAGASHDPTPIHPDGKTKSRPILESEPLGNKFARAIKGYGRFGREVLGDSLVRDSCWELTCRLQIERVFPRFKRKGAEGVKRINARSAKQNQAGVSPPAVFEHIDRAQHIVLKQLPGRVALHSSQNARVSGGIDHPIGVRQKFQVTPAPHVAMQEMNPELSKQRAIQLAPGPAQIIDPKDLDRAVRVSKSAGQGTAHETAYAGNQYFHRVGMKAPGLTC